MSVLCLSRLVCRHESKSVNPASQDEIVLGDNLEAMELERLTCSETTGWRNWQNSKIVKEYSSVECGIDEGPTTSTTVTLVLKGGKREAMPLLEYLSVS